jgi:hypothetical protein
LYENADDLPEDQRIVNGKELPAYKWRGAGVEKHGLELFDHTMVAPVIAEDYDKEFADVHGFPPDWRDTP